MKKQIEALFKKNPNSSFKAKEIAKKLNIFTEHEYSSLKALLYKLFEENFLEKNGKKFKLSTSKLSNSYIGEIQISKKGYGFVISKKSNVKDIFVAERNLGTAANGDIVEAVPFLKQKTKGKNIEGEVVKIIKRKWNEISGTLKKINSDFYVEPDNFSVQKEIFISGKNLKGAKEGERVLVGNIKWENAKLNSVGEVIEILSKEKRMANSLISIAKEFNLPFQFNNETINETNSIQEEIPNNELTKRLDYRPKNVFTIDPEDAKDFDDALSIELLENGNYSVGIHIADVSYYVKEKTHLDKEAQLRGNSVYLVGSVIPMLPEKLSNNVCSLVPNKDRLTYSVIVEITPRAKVVSYQIKKTVINSKRRFSYEEAQKILESKTGDFANDLFLLNKIANSLRKKRMREGSVDFFSTEIKFVLDEFGNPINIFRKSIKESNMLVEEYMLLANQIVAKEIGSGLKNKQIEPFVYRIHDKPDKEKLQEFARFVVTLGYSFSIAAASKAKQLNDLIAQVKDKPEETLINELAIRSMAKAIYSPDNIGHYGLGFKFYTHFTSPIRRYSDLLVHRLLFNYLDTSQRKKYQSKALKEICEHISITERNAVEAERYSIKVMQIEFMKNKIGLVFDGIISGVTNFGLFIKINDILAEGLLHIRDLQGDYFYYDEKKYALTGSKSKSTYRLGDKISVKLIKIDYSKLELDFILA